MAETAVFGPGGYRYVRGRFQYSGGTAAEAGFAIERARFHRPVPLEEGFRRIEAHLAGIGRPPTAFCACELRSPAQFSEEGFIAFNRAYVGTLERWGIFKDEENPVARSNVCPEIDPPAEPSFHAFSYTVRAATGEAAEVKSFVIAGSGEAPEGPGEYRERIIRLGDTSPDAMREKARYVLGAMEYRMAALGLAVGGRYREPGLHGERGPRVLRRRDRRAGCGAGRNYLDVRSPAGRRARLRDGRAKRAGGAGDRLIPGSPAGPECPRAVLYACAPRGRPPRSGRRRRNR